MNAVSVPMPPSTMRRLWERMVAVYGYRWASAYGEAAEDSGALTLAAETWQRGLSDLSPRQIGHGLQACIASADPWPPTLPAFRALCIGIPSIHAVRSELRGPKERRSPFATMLRATIDAHAYATLPADRADRLLRDAYDAVRERVMSGESLPEPAALLERVPETRTPASSDAVRRACSDIERLAGDDTGAAP